MRTWMVLTLAVAGCISKGTEIPPLTAGNGVTVDPTNETVSIDPKRVPVLADCGPNQVVMKNGAGSFICTSTVPDSSSLGGTPASSYALASGTVANATTLASHPPSDFLAATAQAVDSAMLGGQPPTSYATATNGVANNSALLGGQPPTSYATATGGVANNSAALSGLSSNNYVKQNATTGAVQLAGDVPLGDEAGFRATFSNTNFCIHAGFTCDRTQSSAQTSEAGVFCGSASATTGSFSATEPGTGLANPVTATGYRAGKILCEAQCTSPNAHVCQASEILRSREIGIGIVNRFDLIPSVPSGWYSTGSLSTSGGATPKPVNDCLGWTDATANNSGPLWNGAPASGLCNSSNTVLCCK